MTGWNNAGGRGVRRRWRPLPLPRAGLIAAALLALAVALPAAAMASPPRPWLCRDKPVFSANTPMRYTVSNSGARRWQMLFMQFEMGGPNDGFAIVGRRYIAPQAQLSGTLPAGQYYGLAMFARGGHWICPRFVRDHDETTPGVVSSMCYGESSCQVNLKILPVTTAASLSAAPPPSNASPAP